MNLQNIKFINFYKKCSIQLITKSAIFFLFISAVIINFTGCCVYSFTGASVPKHIKTIAISASLDRSGSGEPGLAEMLTNQLTQKFVDDNTLQVTSKADANSIIECTITSLTDAPAVVTAGEKVTQRRITITVQAVYRDLVLHKTIFDKSFSNYGDYPAEGGISARRDAMGTAIDRITADILLDTVSGW